MGVVRVHGAGRGGGNERIYSVYDVHDRIFISV